MRSFSLPLALGAIVVLAFAAIVSVVYVTNENGFYIWDFRNYWLAYREWGEALKSDMFGALQRLRWDVRDSEYNSLFALPLAPFNWVFGESRMGFVLGVALIYLTPAAFAAAFLTRAVLNENTRRVEMLLVLVAAAMLYPPFWTPTLRGFPDVGGLAALALAGALVLGADWRARIWLWRAFALGLLIWAPFLFRKWYAYSLLVFGVSAFSLVVWRAYEAGLSRAHLRNICANFAIAGIVAASGALVFQSGLLLQAASTQYGNIYEAYQLPFLGHLRRILEQFGVFYLALSVGGAIMLLQRTQTRPLGLFLIANVGLTYLFIARTQAPDPHHFLPIALWMFVLAAAGAAEILKRVQAPVRKYVLSGLALAAAAVFAFTYAPLPPPIAAIADVLHPAARRPPLQLQSPEAFAALHQELRALLTESDTFTVFAGSRMDSRAPVSDGMIDAWDDLALSRAMLRSSDVDLRDGLPITPLLARFALVAVPIQTHLRPEAQQGIVIPAHLLLSGEGIGAAYAEIGAPRAMGADVSLRIFERQRAFTSAEIADILARFYEFYPQWRADDQVYSFWLGTTIRASENASPMRFEGRTMRVFLGRTPVEIDFPPLDGRVHIQLLMSEACAATPEAAVLVGGVLTPLALSSDAEARLDLSPDTSTMLHLSAGADVSCASALLTLD